jgi:hypothetical protein
LEKKGFLDKLDAETCVLQQPLKAALFLLEKVVKYLSPASSSLSASITFSLECTAMISGREFSIRVLQIFSIYDLLP